MYEEPDLVLTHPCEQRSSIGTQMEGTKRSNTCVWNGTVSNWIHKWQHSSMRIHRMLNRSKLTFKWVVCLRI